MQVSWRKSDFIDISKTNDSYVLEAKGCHKLLSKITQISPIPVQDVEKLFTTLGNDHIDLLIKEALLKIQNKWDYPYKEDELCHCRMIPVKTVDEAIIGGLHKPEEIGQYCSAGITCGNCRVDIENILDYRLTKK